MLRLYIPLELLNVLASECFTLVSLFAALASYRRERCGGAEEFPVGAALGLRCRRGLGSWGAEPRVLSPHRCCSASPELLPREPQQLLSRTALSKCAGICRIAAGWMCCQHGGCVLTCFRRPSGGNPVLPKAGRAFLTSPGSPHLSRLSERQVVEVTWEGCVALLQACGLGEVLRGCLHTVACAWKRFLCSRPLDLFVEQHQERLV